MPSLAARLFEERYRRALLREDGGEAVRALALVHAGYFASLRNDAILSAGRPGLGFAVAVRVVAALVALGCAFVFLRTKRPRTFLVASWVAWGSLVVLSGIVWHARAMTGELLGPILAGFALVCVLFFALHGPLLPRLVPALALSTLLVVQFRDLVVKSSHIADVTLLIVLVGTATMGALVHFASERHRRERFRAERDNRLARRELAARLAEIAAEKERAEQLARAKSDFLATMSHEFRTPMNAILGLTELLGDHPLPPGPAGHVRTIRESARALLVLLEDLLDFSKIDAGKVTLRAAPFDPRALAASVMEMFRPEADQKGLALELLVQVPAALEADARRIRQVLVNLVGNAVKFTSRGSVSLRMSSTTAAPWMLTAEVIDTGVGIPKAALTRIFSPFEQLEVRGARRGTGLGLAISERLVRAMGGAIVVESARGIGSTFRFSIPVRPADAAPIATPAVPMMASLRILLVEDHPVNQRVAVAMLEKLGHTADVVSDGAAAVAAVTARPYDLVFLDLRLPDGNGLDFVRHLRASRDGLRVVAMTANAMPEDRAACAAAGMDDFLAKPFSSHELAAALARAVEARAVDLVRRSSPGAVVH